MGADTDELEAEEPRTPMWLPLLGGALFLFALLLFLATRPDEDGDGVQAPQADSPAAEVTAEGE